MVRRHALDSELSSFKQEMEWKPFPKGSGQATKQKARWAERKGHGKQRPKELLRSPFLTNAIVEQDQPALVQKQLHLQLSSC